MTLMGVLRSNDSAGHVTEERGGVDVHTEDGPERSFPRISHLLLLGTGAGERDGGMERRKEGKEGR